MTIYNCVILTGRVLSPLRHQYRPDGSPVIQFSLELDDSKDPSDQGDRSLINIVAFGKLAELNATLLQNGQQLLVVGRLKERHWQTAEGKKRTRIEVIATDLQKLEEINHSPVLPATVSRQMDLIKERRKE